MKLHLIDGTHELFRAFIGAAPAKGPDGREVGATRGLLRSLLALLNRNRVTHAGVAFDRVIGSFRNDLHRGYGTGLAVDPDLLSQLPLAERVGRALGLVVWPMIDFEAGDALATAAARFQRDELLDQVFLCSPMESLAQCVRGDRVVLLDRQRNLVTAEAGVVRKCGVHPSSIPDYHALAGDCANGVSGIPGWDAESAATIVGTYGAIEDIPDDAEKWPASVGDRASLARALRENRGAAMLHKRLATLRTDVPLPETLYEMRWQGARRELLVSLCADISLDETGPVRYRVGD